MARQATCNKQHPAILFTALVLRLWHYISMSEYNATNKTSLKSLIRDSRDFLLQIAEKIKFIMSGNKNKLIFPSLPKSHKTVVYFEKTSLPSLMKNVHMQLDSRVAAILQILVDRQEELNGKVEHVILILHKIHRKLAPEEETIIKPKELPTLPLTDEDSFSDFQKFLIHDTNFY
ncbi:hypothetical protein X777_14479, partial [Ooceraea biroi]